MRKLLIGLVVLALGLGTCASAAFAVVDIQGAGPITVQLTILPYTQIWFQDDNWNTPPAGPGTNEPDIKFSGTVGSDYYRSAGLIGQYLPTDSASGTARDGWAYGYFESTDGATIFMQSNTDFSGTIVTSGDLTGTVTTATIPTWFTIAVTGYDPTISGPDPLGFRLGNSGSVTGWVDDGVIPFASMGGYAGNGNAVGEDVAGPVAPFSFGSQAFFPNQDAFRMSTTAGWTFDMDAPVGPGTMKFLARCLRSGVADPADSYTTTITPTFTAP